MTMLRWSRFKKKKKRNVSSVESMKQEKRAGQMSLIISRSSTTEAGVIARLGRSAPMSSKGLLVEASRCLLKRGKSRLEKN